MWERLHALVTKAQMRWLKAEGYTRGKSLAEVVRNLVDGEILRRSKSSESKSSMKQD